MDCELIVKNIEAYLDGELTLSDHRDFEVHINDCDSCKAKLESMRAIQTAVRRADYAGTPSSLKANIQNQLRDYTGEDSKSLTLLNWFGLGGGGLVTGSLATWLIVTFLISTPVQLQLADEIISSHVRSLMVDHVTDVKSTDKHMVKPWFNGRIDFSPTVRDLKDEGYILVGGRLDYIQGKATAALIYKRRAHIINTYVFKSKNNNKTMTLKEVSQQGYNLVYWIENGLEYWVVSDLNKKELHEFARKFSAVVL